MGAAVAAVALNAAIGLVPSSWARAGPARGATLRWVVFALLGAVSAATIGPFLVLVLLACGAVEVAVALRNRSAGTLRRILLAPFWPSGADGWHRRTGLGGLQGRRLSYGGGFVIIPLDAGRCGEPLPLDDECAVSQRGGSRPDHARPGGSDGGRGGLRRCGHRRCAPGHCRRLRSFVPFRPRRRPALRCAAEECGCAGFLVRGRTGRHRRHRRLVDPLGSGDLACVAAGDPRPRPSCGSWRCDAEWCRPWWPWPSSVRWRGSSACPSGVDPRGGDPRGVDPGGDGSGEPVVDRGGTGGVLWRTTSWICRIRSSSWSLRSIRATRRCSTRTKRSLDHCGIAQVTHDHFGVQADQPLGLVSCDLGGRGDRGRGIGGERPSAPDPARRPHDGEVVDD